MELLLNFVGVIMNLWLCRKMTISRRCVLKYLGVKCKNVCNLTVQKKKIYIYRSRNHEKILLTIKSR